MPRTLVDAKDVDDVCGFEGCSAQDLAALEELLERETKFAQVLGDVLFVLEAQTSCHLPRRGCFRRKIESHREF